MTGKISVELLSSPEELEKFIMSAIKKALAEAIKKSAKQIESQFSELVYKSVYNCMEMQELRGGGLRHELGLSSGQASSASEDIARTVADSVFVETQSPKGRDIGGLSVNIQPSNFANVLSISGSTVDYFSKRYKEIVSLQWLDWLLNRGDAIIVGKFHFQEQPGKGRSGGGRMYKGGSWKISSQFSGVEDNNFISRALGERASRGKMERIIEKTIQKNWK